MELHDFCSPFLKFDLALLYTHQPQHIRQNQTMAPRKPSHSLKRHKRAKLWGITIIGFTSIAAHSAWQAPLNESEKSKAELLALSNQADSSPSLRRRDVSEHHPLGLQVLLVEPQEQKKTKNHDSKVVEVFVFNHHTHLAERTLVNLSSNTLISSQQISGVHLPLSEEEIAYSIDAVRRDVSVQTKLLEEHATLAHRANKDIMAGLKLRVAIWVPTTIEHAGDSRCDHERCALISLFDADNISYTTEPVVNLKTGKVALDVIQ